MQKKYETYWKECLYLSDVILFLKHFCNFQIFSFYINFIQNYIIYLENFDHISPMIKLE